MALEGAERAAVEDIGLREWLQQLLWPRAPFVRELLIGVAEGGWSKVPSDIVHALESMFRGPAGSKDSEDTLNVVRRCTNKTSSGGLRMASQWHRSIFGSVLEEFGKKQPEQLPVDKVGVTGKVPSEMFEADSCEFSLGKGELHKHMGGKWGKPPAPSNWLMVPVAHHA